MASGTQSTLPIVTTTRFDVSQGKTITVQDFLRGLKRPGSNAAPAKASLARKDHDDSLLATIKDNRHPNANSSDETPSIPIPIARTLIEHAFIRSRHKVSSGKSIKTDPQQQPCSSPAVGVAKFSSEPAADGVTNSLDAPKLVRTYGKKNKQSVPPTEDLLNSSLPFCTQSSTADQILLPRPLEAIAQAQVTSLGGELFGGTGDQGKDEPHSSGQNKSQGGQQRTLRVVSFSAEIATGEPRRKRRKRRSAPVDELVLVVELPSQSGSVGKAMVESAISILQILANENGQHERRPQTSHDQSISRRYRGSVELSEQSTAKRKRPNKANIGRPVTKLCCDLVTPRHDSINPQDFKFPPMTPRITRSPGWQIGSGFEGITLQTSGLTGLTSHGRKNKRSKTVRFMDPPLRPLEMSTKLSPTAKASNSRAPPLGGTHLTESENQSSGDGDLILHVEAAASANEVISDQIQTLVALLWPQLELKQSEDSGKSQELRLSQRPFPSLGKLLTHQIRGADTGPHIRRPSRSERNGWLKRRQRISFTNKDEQHLFPGTEDSHGSAAHDNTEQLFEAHNATWYGEAEAEPYFQESMQEQGWPESRVLSPEFQIATSSRSPEVQDSQEQPVHESLELSRYPNYPVQDTSLSAGRCFSNTVKKLSSPEKGAHNVVRRKSQVWTSGYSHQSEVEQGSLELGVTPRLKRSLSSVPFRPPFKGM